MTAEAFGLILSIEHATFWRHLLRLAMWMACKGRQAGECTSWPGTEQAPGVCLCPATGGLPSRSTTTKSGTWTWRTTTDERGIGQDRAEASPSGHLRSRRGARTARTLGCAGSRGPGRSSRDTFRFG